MPDIVITCSFARSTDTCFTKPSVREFMATKVVIIEARYIAK